MPEIGFKRCGADDIATSTRLIAIRCQVRGGASRTDQRACLELFEDLVISPSYALPEFGEWDALRSTVALARPRSSSFG